MDAALINTQRPQLTQAAAERRWNNARERNVRTPHPSTSRSRSVHARQGKSVSSLIAAAPATADHQQAEYFVRLLAQSRQRIDQRINNYQRAIAASEASGDTENIRGLRRMARVEEQDRETVGGLIESLQRRFPVRAPGDVPQIPRRARPVVQ
jgi:hypothetical protein